VRGGKVHRPRVLPSLLPHYVHAALLTRTTRAWQSVMPASPLLRQPASRR
jgi:hypothetical protein